ncbi:MULTISPECIES: hypothetical protein [Burkholderia]|uniref:hypothetical protein n=1 Tax=Burkholderia TaxID=32008 RepID=UPI0012E3BEB8|nr:MULTISPECIES: hypothetical protein [Burkholderia]
MVQALHACGAIDERPPVRVRADASIDDCRVNPYLTGRRLSEERIGGRLTLDCMRRIGRSPGKGGIVRAISDNGRRRDPKCSTHFKSGAPMNRIPGIIPGLL